MNDLLRREIVGVGQHRHGGRLLVVRAVFVPKLFHLPGAFRTKLYPRESVDAVVDTVVKRLKAAEHL